MYIEKKNEIEQHTFCLNTIQQYVYFFSSSKIGLNSNESKDSLTSFEAQCMKRTLDGLFIIDNKGINIVCLMNLSQNAFTKSKWLENS